MRKIYVWLFLVVSAVSGCRIEDAGHSGNLKVVCTTGMIGDATKNLTEGLSDSIEVFTLMGPGVDPHLYKPSPDVVNILGNADVIIHNGLHLEGKMADIFNRLKREKIIIEISENLDEHRLLNATVANTGAHDPHIWFNVELWAEAVRYLGSKLSLINGVSREKVLSNTEAYVYSLEELNNWVKDELEKIPTENRVMITSHDAFRYFGDAYNIDVMGLQGISTVAEFGLKDITELVNFIVEEKIPAVFVESSVSGKSMQAVQEGCKSKGHNLEIGGTLYSDAMGAEGTPEGTYIGMVKHNVNTIVKALKSIY